MKHMVTVCVLLVACARPATRSLSTQEIVKRHNAPQAKTQWRSPPKQVLDVLHSPQLPWVWSAPTGEHLLLADPVLYPPLAELAAPMHRLAGMRVNPKVNSFVDQHV